MMRLSPSLAGRRSSSATTPWTDSSPSPSSLLVSSLLAIQLSTPSARLRNACRAWKVSLYQWHVAVSCQTILCLITLIKVSSRALQLLMHLQQYFHSCSSHNVFPMELLTNIFIQILFIVFIYSFMFFNLSLFFVYGIKNNVQDFHQLVLWFINDVIVIFVMTIVPSAENNHAK